MYEKDDLLGALDFLAARGIQRAGVLGFSLGATTAIITAAITDRIAALVAEGAVARLKQTLARRLWRYGVPLPLGWLLAAGAGLRSDDHARQDRSSGRRALDSRTSKRQSCSFTALPTAI